MANNQFAICHWFCQPPAFPAQRSVVVSAWKSSLKTAKKPRLNRTQTTQDQKFPGPSKTNRSLVFGPSGFWKFQDRQKTGLTGLNQSLQPEKLPKYVL